MIPKPLFLLLDAEKLECAIVKFIILEEKIIAALAGLDKLDTLSKWIIVPKLITGRELPRQQKWFELLKKLIKARNSIIHHKSSDAPTFSTDMQQYIKKQEANSGLLDEAARQSAMLLNLLADKIAEIDPQESVWVNAYLT